MAWSTNFEFNTNSIEFETIKRTDPLILALMKVHYSKPLGFVGRNICYAIYYNSVFYGCIVGGSTPTHLPNRPYKFPLNCICNNLFYHVEKQNNKYPIRNFTVTIIKEWVKQIQIDWLTKYNDKLLAVESLVELPRTGEIYKRAGWTEIGITKGYTCKRTGGYGTDNWSGQRVWDTTNLRPKRVFINVL